MKKQVAIVVPLSSRRGLIPDESISVRQLVGVLGGYDRYFVAQPSVLNPVSGFKRIELPEHFFGSLAAHARLITSPQFFEAFAEYEYILMYHLDSLVFRDELRAWCATGLDYIGAPWINCPDSPWVEHERVGNSGFALMKVASFLQVLNSTRQWMAPEDYWQTFYADRPFAVRCVHYPKKWLKHLPTFNSVRFHIQRWLAGRDDADKFWADEAIRYDPEFKIASVEQGLRFAFEVSPRLCLARNKGKLPFGCHAWTRYDRAFWEPHLLPAQSEVVSR